MRLRPEPTSVLHDVLFAAREVAAAVKNAPARIAARSCARRLCRADNDQPALNYGSVGGARRGGLPIGGQIKLIHLQREFPPTDQANILYLVSSALPNHVEEVAVQAKRLGIRIVWNQNGVAYPGCYGDFYPWFNRRMARLRAMADFVVNQSEFSRGSADRYLGNCDAPSAILFNPVDTQDFSPSSSFPDYETWQILAAGTSHALYRTKSVLDTFRVVLKRGHRAHLTIAGEFRWPGASEDVAREMKGMERHVTILPPFRQSEAPGIYRNAHVLLHTKFNDPCPTVPIEAMACGLPVVGTASGGMPELVAPNAGFLVPVEQSWKRDLAGDPEELAAALEKVMKRHREMSGTARTHALQNFDVRDWMMRHGDIFRRCLSMC